MTLTFPYTSERNLNCSKEEYFWYLSNKLGFDNLEICYSYYQNGEKYFSKWISFLWLMEQEPNIYIQKIHMTREEFINKSSHRSVLDFEIMIDIDEKGRFKSIKNKTIAILNKLNRAGIKYSCYFSGSKSYHVSILLPELKWCSPKLRTKIKEVFLKSFGGDLQKASLRNMIALEGEPHWKTNKIKQVAF